MTARILAIAWGKLTEYRFHLPALLILGLWCLPYITTGTKIEWGDFGVFTQGYEAIKVSLVSYHQFPWWNPWIVGGAPLYANPQLGVFSLQTILVIVFGVVRGLKYSLIVYTFAGYFSMLLLLRKYFKLSSPVSIPLSLIWVLSSFFVNHLPSQFTFVWYLLAPLYIYLALTVRNIKSGLVLGLAFAIMALSQVHNAFFQIALACGLVVLVRLFTEYESRKDLLYGLLAGSGLFVLLAGHRIIYTAQNVQNFPRLIIDPAPIVAKSVLAILLPFSAAHPLPFVKFPWAYFGWGEMTATIGIFATGACLISVLFVLHHVKFDVQRFTKEFRLPLIVIGAGLIAFALGCGSFTVWAPYSLLKHAPIFGQMRVSSRWFLGFDLSMLVFIGLIYERASRKSFFRFLTTALLVMGVAELFLLNWGYQSIVLSHPIVIAPKAITAYQFVQTYHFGETLKLPGGNAIPYDDGHMPHFYREYEGTTFNTGVLQANDSLIDLNTKPSPRCSWTYGCNFVMSNNATVTYWSPNRIVLTRTGPGDIELDMNDSNYFVINGTREASSNVAEAYKAFFINLSNSTKQITIAVSPSLSTALAQL